jgi:hypothetical protein
MDFLLISAVFDVYSINLDVNNDRAKDKLYLSGPNRCAHH